MKKNKSRSQASLRSSKSTSNSNSKHSKSDIEARRDQVYLPPLDELVVEVLCLRLFDDDKREYTIKICFFDQLIVNDAIQPIGIRDVESKETLAEGTMCFDPSDREKMCLFADNPLVIKIQPSENTVVSQHGTPTLLKTRSGMSPSKSISTIPNIHANSFCCNLDVLSLFIDTDSICVRKRLQPILTRSVLNQISWENLPLITLKLSAIRHPANKCHHEILKNSNYMQLTFVGAYNLPLSISEEHVYTAASKMPLENEANSTTVMYTEGYREPKKFSNTNFYPKWASLLEKDEKFSGCLQKVSIDFKNVYNEECIDLNHYFSASANCYAVVWASFHRTLILENSQDWFLEQIREYKWPVEVHINSQQEGHSFMAFLNLFKLLYPGEHTMSLVVPLHWANPEAMLHNCGCQVLFAPNEHSGLAHKTSKATSSQTSSTNLERSLQPTGADDGFAFILVQVKLRRPFKEVVIQKPITEVEIEEFLQELEKETPTKRECTGRGQPTKDWKQTVLKAVDTLRRVPYYGATEMHALNSQLSTSRARIELHSSFWQEASIYVNNNFIVQDFLESDGAYEELLMMSHACLMRETHDTLLSENAERRENNSLRAARHARQLQNISHAVDLYSQVVTEQKYDPGAWRELATCLRDVDHPMAAVCLNKALLLDMRHPLTLLSKASVTFEEDPNGAEPFFFALIALHPNWNTGLVAARVYYLQRGLFHIADNIMDYIEKNTKDNCVENLSQARVWGEELGDWWENTELSPGVNCYHDATDLLLRLRATTLAELCLARAVREGCRAVGGAAHCHLSALCYRLQGNGDAALAALHDGLREFGEISYLRALEAECFHVKQDYEQTRLSFDKAGERLGPFSMLISSAGQKLSWRRAALAELVRRFPSAQAWLALAQTWLMSANELEEATQDSSKQGETTRCACACLAQALRCDRLAARAWCLLSELSAPSARRLFYMNMASSCGYEWTRWQVESRASQQSACWHLGEPLRDCRCRMCDHFKL